MIRRGLRCVILGVGLAAISGCGVSLFNQPPGELRLVSRDTGETTGNAVFAQALYRYESDSNLTVLLYDGTADDPTRVAILSMFWRPRAGSTPVDRTATNTVIRYIDTATPEAGDDTAGADPNAAAAPAGLGVYAGAGFMRVYSDPAGVELNATLFDGDLRLTDASEGFADPLGRTALAGSFTARRDDAQVTTILRRLTLRISDALGYPRLVRNHTKPDAS